MSEKTMSYREYRKERQEGVNALPLHWAFSNEQFDELCEKLGGKEPKDFYRGPAGSFYLKEDAHIIHEWLDKPDPLSGLMKDYEFAYDAFLYEMGNHEYHINWQADYDVINCFTKVDYDEGEEKGYLELTGWEPQTKKAYLDARKEFYRQCDENDLW